MILELPSQPLTCLLCLNVRRIAYSHIAHGHGQGAWESLRSHPFLSISCSMNYMQMRRSDAPAPTTTPTSRASMASDLSSQPLTCLLRLNMRRCTAYFYTCHMS